MKTDNQKGKNPDKSKAGTTPPLTAQQGEKTTSSAAKMPEQKTPEDDLQDRKGNTSRREVQ